jgi:hypothetical protein
MNIRTRSGDERPPSTFTRQLGSVRLLIECTGQRRQLCADLSADHLQRRPGRGPATSGLQLGTPDHNYPRKGPRLMTDLGRACATQPGTYPRHGVGPGQLPCRLTGVVERQRRWPRAIKVANDVASPSTELATTCQVIYEGAGPDHGEALGSPGRRLCTSGGCGGWLT